MRAPKRGLNALLNLRVINYSCEIFFRLTPFKYHNALLETQMRYRQLSTKEEIRLLRNTITGTKNNKQTQNINKSRTIIICL